MKHRKKRIISIKVLPGEPLDGTGRVCIHLFVQDEHGPFEEPHAVHPVFESGEQVKQMVSCKPTRGRLACDGKRLPTPVVKGNIVVITPRTDDPRAVTCLKCKESKEHKEMMEKFLK